MKNYWYWITGIIILIIIVGVFLSNNARKSSPSTVSPSAKSDVIETLTISCDGPRGESFYLLTTRDGYDITAKKITCEKGVEVLERTCIPNAGSPKGDEIEMDRVRQENLEGWAQRKDLTCKDIGCNIAPDSICNEME